LVEWLLQARDLREKIGTLLAKTANDDKLIEALKVLMNRV
jgi:hypothetical protein